MLYNVTFGNTNYSTDDWKKVDINGKIFYEKKDIDQRIRVNLAPKQDASMAELVPGWKTAQVQQYKTKIPMEFKNNTVNMNAMLRPLGKGYEDNESIVVYVTIVNNYQIVDFETKYQILNTYHKFGMHQGCVVVLNKKELEEKKDSTILTVYAYNRKKGVPNMLSIRIKSDFDKKTRKKSYDTNVLTTHVTPIKDATERDRVIAKAEENKDSFLGFKCIVNPKKFLTAVYFVHPDFKDHIDNMVRFSNKDIVVVTPEEVQDHDKMRQLLEKHCENKKVRAITTVGVTPSLHDLRNARILFVFSYDAKTQGLRCIKSN